MAAIYIHIPFCQSKCFYCDFVSFANLENMFEPYKNALLAEINQSNDLGDEPITSIFIGGGTPSVLPTLFLDEIMSSLRRFNISENAEITLEANPGTIDIGKLSAYKSMGINRLSMGLQSVQNHLLKEIGRIHTFEMFHKNYNDALKVGFDNINVDLMFSLPHQTMEDLQISLDKTLDLQPTHVSVYSLIIEENTPFGRLHKAGKLSQASEETDRAMYELVKFRLKSSGYEHYEISNFAKDNAAKEKAYSRHNTLYWQRGNYLGLGLCAHSLIGDVRFSNESDLQAYILANGDTEKIRKDKENLTQNEAMSEFMFLGLRMLKGVSTHDFYKHFNKNIFDVFASPIEKHARNGLLNSNETHVWLTEKGVDVSNFVFVDFLL